MTDDIEAGALSDEQNVRAVALAVAREALADESVAMIVKGKSLPKRFGVEDIIDLANWIIDGVHPLAEYRERTGAWEAESPTLSTDEPSPEVPPLPDDLKEIAVALMADAADEVAQVEHDRQMDQEHD